MCNVCMPISDEASATNEFADRLLDMLNQGGTRLGTGNVTQSRIQCHRFSPARTRFSEQLLCYPQRSMTGENNGGRSDCLSPPPLM